MKVSEIQAMAYTTAKSKGFHDTTDPDSVEWALSKLALIHSEVSEALECVRDGDVKMTFREDGKPEGLPSELADIVIRVADFAEVMKINLSHAIDVKMAHNTTREHMHGKKI